jgi:hypothetical protein
MRERWVFLLLLIALSLFCWRLVDWTVYLETGRDRYEPAFQLALPEQIAGSILAGASVVAVLWAGVWLSRRPPDERTVLDKLAIALAVGGAVLGWSLLYLSFRVPGDFLAHYHFLGQERPSYHFGGIGLLLVSQIAALLLGVAARSRPLGRVALSLALFSLAALGVSLLVGLIG